MFECTLWEKNPKAENPCCTTRPRSAIRLLVWGGVSGDPAGSGEGRLCRLVLVPRGSFPHRRPGDLTHRLRGPAWARTGGGAVPTVPRGNPGPRVGERTLRPKPGVLQGSRTRDGRGTTGSRMPHPTKDKFAATAKPHVSAGRRGPGRCRDAPRRAARRAGGARWGRTPARPTDRLYSEKT